ncbi:MAG: hypothetical protein AB1472_00500 [Candidatus Omnitrophota bacterium]
MNKKAQALIEYVLVIALIAAALAGMQTYLRRGIQGVIKTASDDFGDQKKGLVTKEPEDIEKKILKSESTFYGTTKEYKGIKENKEGIKGQKVEIDNTTLRYGESYGEEERE